MQYIDRKKTPLKFNWVLKIGLPISFVINVYNLYDTISSLFFWNQSSSLNTGMNAAGYSMQNMGIFFWPVIINVIFMIVYSILLFYASVGLWKWKNYGPKAAFIYMLLSLIQNIFYIVLIRMNPIYINAVIEYTETSSVLSTSTVMLLYTMTFVIVSLYYAILSVCTFLYYKKRKLLFDEYYIQPQTENVYVEPVVQETETKVEEEPIIQETDATVEDEQQSEVSAFQPYYCTECGTKITDENTQYCPNCGKKLK